MQLGLPAPGTQSAPPPVMSIGGIVPVMGAEAVLNMERSFADAMSSRAQELQASALITGLAGRIRAFWDRAEEAKSTVEDEMLEALLSRRGEYTAAKKAQIAKQGQPEIYMMVAAAKMRQIEALMRDVLIGAGTEKPWTLRPSPVPELPFSVATQVVQALQMEIAQAMQMGVHVDIESARQRVREMKEQATARLNEEAAVLCDRMEQKMEDQLVEGNYLDALDQFITDLATFKTAFIAGPIIRRKPRLKWGPMGDLTVEVTETMTWERVDPFDVYPAPWARNINEGPLIRRHKLTREDLVSMIGVEGYDEASIREVLKTYGEDGHYEWLSIDTEKADAEGKDTLEAVNRTGLIDALQYWGSASGQMLLDWGMDKAQVPDPEKEYQIEAWLIDNTVIKAVLNADPLARRPIYADSFQRVPGSVWGSGPYDLLKDCQDMCNATARALAANMGISSGPQVGILSDRVSDGEEITTMFPWKLWQFSSDLSGGSAKPIEFFQPQSNAQELLAVYDRFSQYADEYTGIPRYMAGFNSEGASRTASGMSMMIGNASKVIKQVVGSVDFNVIKPMLERLYYYNMRYGDDPDLKGDVQIVARGAMSLTTKEAAQVRTAEFLTATANPIDMQIVGLDGRAELLRQAVKRLDVNPDKVVPPVSVLKERAAAMAMQQAQMAAQEAERPQQPPKGGQKSRERLQNGAPVTDHYSPQGA